MSSKINDRIVMYRKKINYSKKEMANSLGIKYTTYCRMEEKGNITGEWLLKISEVLGVDVRKFLYDEIPENKDWQPAPPKTENCNKKPEVIIGYKYINQNITVMENRFLNLLKMLPLKEQREIFDIVYKKVLK